MRKTSFTSLIMLLFVLLLCVPAQAEDSAPAPLWEYRTEEGEITLLNYLGGLDYMNIYDGNGTITIPAEIDGKPVVALSDYFLDFLSGRVRFEVERGSSAFLAVDGCLFSADGETMIACDRGIQGEYEVPSGTLTIGSNCFRGCDGLSAVSLPSSVTAIGSWAFEDCSGLSALLLPDGLQSLGYGAFSGCAGLTEMAIPGGVTELGERALAGCTSLVVLTLHEGLTEIGQRALENCAGIGAIELPESLLYIGDEAFYGCAGLTEMRFPGSLKSVGSFAFYHCTALLDALFEGDALVKERAFEDCPDQLTIHAAAKSGPLNYAMTNDVFYRTVK